jgi:hypothetical protein
MAGIAGRERMRKVLKRWRRSGLSAAEFCRREGMAPQALSYWKRALGRAKAVVRRRRGARPVGFVPVRLVDSNAGVATVGGLEISLASGDRLVVCEGVSRELLRDALMVLRERERC